MSENLHVVFGTGPVGSWIARTLSEAGEEVRAVNRTGKRPDLIPNGVEVVSADVSDPEQAIRAADGAGVLYQALNPPYHLWQQLFPGLQSGALAAAKASGARYISIDNLYMYGRVEGAMTEDSPIAPCSRKGELRARMGAEVLAAHDSGEVRAAILRSSDYYGPGVTLSAFGERTFMPLLAGKGGEAVGNEDLAHSFAYIEDVARAAVVLGTRDEALGGVWFTPHATAQSQRTMIDESSRLAGVKPRVNVVNPLMLRAVGLFSPSVREMNEMMYEFTNAFVVDSSKIEREFDLSATPLTEGLSRTLAWYRKRATA
jgi:nucleoside-diphosphate-sugar epimerase